MTSSFMLCFFFLVRFRRERTSLHRRRQGLLPPRPPQACAVAAPPCSPTPRLAMATLPRYGRVPQAYAMPRAASHTVLPSRRSAAPAMCERAAVASAGRARLAALAPPWPRAASQAMLPSRWSRQESIWPSARAGARAHREEEDRLFFFVMSRGP
jgi:hypothetical protein